MSAVTRFPKLVIGILVCVSVLSLSACGTSEYLDAFNSAMSDFNSAASDMTSQVEQLNEDNELYYDSAWQEETSAVLDTFQSAGDAFNSLPEAPEGYTALDQLAKELFDATSSYVDTFYTGMNEGDLSYIDTANEYMDQINSLLGDINNEIDGLNE